MSKIGMSLTSTIRHDMGRAFPKANDRFYLSVLNGKRHSPSPTSYTLPGSVGFDDTKRSAAPFVTTKQGRTVFGRENRSKKFGSLLTPNEVFNVPGPGHYAFYTQFNNDQKMLSIEQSVLGGGRSRSNNGVVSFDARSKNTTSNAGSPYRPKTSQKDF